MKNIRAEGIKQKNPTIVWIVGLSVSLSHLSGSGKNPLHSDSCVYPHLALSILVIRNSDSKIPCAAVWQVSWLTVQVLLIAFPMAQWHYDKLLLLTVTRSRRSFTCFPILRFLKRHQLLLIQFHITYTSIITVFLK